jgi:CheY-like chemotaxis protein
LTFCKKVVEAHEGTILIYSDGRDKGTRVSIALPVYDVPELQPDAGLDLPAGVGMTLRVLLVEDHAATARILRSLLEADGHDVLLARSIAEAKQCIAANDFDLLLSDLGLPDGHGSELPALVKRKRNIPCIALSGYGQPEELERSQRAGFATHLVKPVTMGQLRKVIASIVDQPAVQQSKSRHE